MNIRLLILLAALPLAGCDQHTMNSGLSSAADTAWDRPGGAASVEQDRKICRFEAAKSPGASAPVAGVEWLTTSQKFEEMFRLCIKPDPALCRQRLSFSLWPDFSSRLVQPWGPRSHWES